jgi:hypothetical protein
MLFFSFKYPLDREEELCSITSSPKGDLKGTADELDYVVAECTTEFREE